MLSCGALPGRRRYHQRQTSRAMPQLYLNFTDIPIPETCLWEQFDDQQKQIVIQTLARLLVQTIRNHSQEQPNE